MNLSNRLIPQKPFKPCLMALILVQSSSKAKHPKAGAYHFQMCKGTLPLTEDGWVLCGVSTSAEFELSGLDVMCIYYFRIAAITPEGLTDYSEPVSKIVV